MCTTGRVLQIEPRWVGYVFVAGHFQINHNISIVQQRTYNRDENKQRNIYYWFLLLINNSEGSTHRNHAMTCVRVDWIDFWSGHYKFYWFIGLLLTGMSFFAIAPNCKFDHLSSINVRLFGWVISFLLLECYIISGTVEIFRLSITINLV